MPPDREHRDALPDGPVRGRAANLNPGNRFEAVRLHILGERLDEAAAERPEGARVATRIFPDRTRSIINRVESPDVGFSWTVNPYRGCEHGCIYCYARPSHELLGLSCGLDFETKIAAKLEAPGLLRRELAAARWSGEPIVMSGITDPYQPAEARLGITRACLEVMAEFRQPAGLITKNKLILRDLDVMRRLHAHGAVSAAVSLTTLDRGLAGLMEPRASAPSDRLAAIRGLAAAGIPVRVMMAPIIPGLTDHEIPRVLEAAAEAGARGAGYVLLRLPHQVKDLFLEWLGRNYPDRAAKAEAFVRESRGGELYRSAWFERQRGRGPRAEQIGRTFNVFRRRFGLDGPFPELSSAAFRRSEGGQMPLF